jgi:hypothetical protein
LYSPKERKKNKAIERLNFVIGQHVDIFFIDGDKIEGILDSYCMNVPCPFYVIDNGHGLVFVMMENVSRMSWKSLEERDDR